MRKIIAVTGPSVFNDYIKSLIQDYYGACPLYTINDEQEDLDWIANHSDALMLSGGVDIFPGTVEKVITTGNGYTKFDIKRDKRELYLYDKFIELGKPVALICRGFQLILTARFGFRLLTDISGCSILHSPGSNKIDINYEDGEYPHIVNFVGEYKKVFKEDEEDNYFTNWSGVSSAHHQAVIRVKDSDPLMRVMATANTETVEKDNIEIVEMAECPEHKIIGGQFHWEICTEGFLAHRIVAERFKKMLG